MVAFYQQLETRFDLGRRGLAFEAERVERPALGVVDHARLAPAQVVVVARAGLAEQPERIVRIGEAGAEARRVRAPFRLAAIHAHLPGRAMADHRLALILGDVVSTHTGKE